MVGRTIWTPYWPDESRVLKNRRTGFAHLRRADQSPARHRGDPKQPPPLSYLEDDVQLPTLTPNSFLFTNPNILPELAHQHLDEREPNSCWKPKMQCGIAGCQSTCEHYANDTDLNMVMQKAVLQLEMWLSSNRWSVIATVGPLALLRSLSWAETKSSVVQNCVLASLS